MHKRTLLLTLDFPPRRGGVARYLFELVRQLAAHQNEGGEIRVVAQREQGAEDADRLATFPLQRRRLLASWLWPHWLPALFLLLLQRNSYDQLLVSHVLPLGVAAWMSQKITGKPYLIILHGMDFALARRNPWKRKLTKRVLESAALVVTNTENLEREVRGFAKTRATQVVYPCLGTEIQDASRVPRPEQTTQGPLSLLTVARLVPRKGHIAVLDALALLRDRGRLPHLHYHIVGDGPMYEPLARHCKELKLNTLVTFHRNVTDRELLDFYRDASLFVMPTEHLGRDIEGFGIVYIEAGAFALPVIASDLPGVTEAVIDGETGILVPAGSVPDLADAIEILARNPERCRELGEKGRERAWNLFNPERQWSVLESYL